MHRNKEPLMSKADDIHQRFESTSMSPGDNNVPQLTGILTCLHEQIRISDIAIMDEEASLGDVKRDKAPVRRPSQVSPGYTTPVTPKWNSSWRRPNERFANFRSSAKLGSRLSAKPTFRSSAKLVTELNRRTDCLPATPLETLLQLSTPRSNKHQYQRNQSNLTHHPRSPTTQPGTRTSLLAPASSIHISNPMPACPDNGPAFLHSTNSHPYRMRCLHSPTTRFVIYTTLVTSASMIPKSRCRRKARVKLRNGMNHFRVHFVPFSTAFT